MGTNYYVEDGKKCSKCGTGGEEIHIGKSSAGWEFTFAWNNGEYYKSLPELKKWLRGRQIVDEYGRKVTKKDFWGLVEVKIGGLNLDTYDEEYPNHNTFNVNPKEYYVLVDGVRFMKGEFS